jgi:hypothetical protein
MGEVEVVGGGDLDLYEGASTMSSVYSENQRAVQSTVVDAAGRVDFALLEHRFYYDVPGSS